MACKLIGGLPGYTRVTYVARLVGACRAEMNERTLGTIKIAERVLPNPLQNRLLPSGFSPILDRSKDISPKFVCLFRRNQEP